jgi:hypothetical protein
MIFGCGGRGEEKQKQQVEFCSFNASFKTGGFQSVIKTYVTRIIIFSPLASPAYRIKLFFSLRSIPETARFSWIQFINYAKYILCTRTKKNLSHARRYPHPTKLFLCMLQNRYHNLIRVFFVFSLALASFRKEIIFYYD